MRIYSKLAIVLGTWVTASSAFAVSTGSGTLTWDFGSEVSSVQYLYSEGYIGNIGTQQIFLDDNWEAHAVIGSSSLNAVWDPVTGAASSFDFTAQTETVGVGTSVGINYLVGYTIYTDILNVSLNYQYEGQRSSLEQGNSAGFLTQVEISSGGEVFYTDYDPSHPTYEDTFENHSIQDGLYTLSVNDTRTFQFGEEGEYRNWVVYGDIIAYGSDNVAAVPVPAGLVLLMSAVFTLLGLRKRQE